ncbi:MAG: Spy0128 family protein [Anaerovoracaceae bacterium]
MTKTETSLSTKFAYTTESLKKAVKMDMRSRAGGRKRRMDIELYRFRKTDNFAETGLTGVKTSFAFTVTVTDDGKGGLTAEVNYPEDDGMTFRNIYSTGEDVTVNISGNKVLNAEPGLNPPDISGKFSFKLTGSAGAPMPSSDTAVNDGSGNIVFGDVKQPQHAGRSGA